MNGREASTSVWIQPRTSCRQRIIKKVNETKPTLVFSLTQIQPSHCLFLNGNYDTNVLSLSPTSISYLELITYLFTCFAF